MLFEEFQVDTTNCSDVEFLENLERQSGQRPALADCLHSLL